MVRILTSGLALRTSIGSENVVPVVGPVKVTTCSPFLTFPFNPNRTALLPLSSNGVVPMVLSTFAGLRLTSPTLMSSVASLASPGPVMASEDRLTLKSCPIR